MARRVTHSLGRASYLITFRDDGGSRLPLLMKVIDWLAGLNPLEVIVVEQDRFARLAPAPRAPNVRTLFVYNDGPFNKSWGLNVAARHAEGELLVTGDADMLMSDEALARALQVCRERYDAVSPYSGLVDLYEAETRALLRGEIGLEDIQRVSVSDRLAEGEYICFCGGICVYRREVYFALGGMDERFLGWGGEDDAMSINLQRYTERLAVQRGTVAYHLWHPRPPDRYRHPHYRENLALAAAYRNCGPEGLERWRADQRAGMGDVQRYRPPE